MWYSFEKFNEPPGFDNELVYRMHMIRDASLISGTSEVYLIDSNTLTEFKKNLFPITVSHDSQDILGRKFVSFDKNKFTFDNYFTIPTTFMESKSSQPRTTKSGRRIKQPKHNDDEIYYE